MLSKFRRTLSLWHKNRSSSRELSRLSGRDLDDLGFIPGDIYRGWRR
ncbi:DUF1127 domain-containing protein [Coralliovum pocilloporae]